jgi:DnaJ-class molecular chaperone
LYACTRSSHTVSRKIISSPADYFSTAVNTGSINWRKLKNHYQTLGLERTGIREEIKQAYRKLALKFHPDKNDGDRFFEDRFKHIQEAYEILIDPIEKARYDQEFDIFFYGGNSQQYDSYRHTHQQSYGSETRFDPEAERRKKEAHERMTKQHAEQQRIRLIKRNAELSFEDKAWIGIASGFSIGIVGVIMFIKYLSEGYNKKSQQVCIVAIVGFAILMFLSILITAANPRHGH